MLPEDRLNNDTYRMVVYIVYLSKHALIQVPALIPLIDLANHSDFCSISGSLHYDVNTKMSNFQIEKNVFAGDELLIYYGTRTNKEFLLHNGFVPNFFNPDDSYELRIGWYKVTTL